MLAVSINLVLEFYCGLSLAFAKKVQGISTDSALYEANFFP